MRKGKRENRREEEMRKCDKEVIMYVTSTK